jgi:hypothetical protein
MPDVIEKRKHPRFQSKRALKYHLLRNSPPQIQHSHSIDVSEEGMSFRSTEFTPPDMHRPMSFVSEVVHAREHAEGNHFIIGMQFEHMLK